MDDTKLYGLAPDRVYIDLRKTSIEEAAELLSWRYQADIGTLLDRPVTRWVATFGTNTDELVETDPDAALRRQPEPLLLDEWQSVPSVLGAVKRAIDDDPQPGRFLLTGSVRAAATSISRFPAASRSRSSGCPDRVGKRGWMDISTSY